MREKGKGRTTTHFFFSKDFTKRTRRSLVQLRRDKPNPEGQQHRKRVTHSSFRGRASPVPSFGSAVLQVLVGLVDLTLSPTLATHEFHFQVEGAPSPCCCSQAYYPASAHPTSSSHALPTYSTAHSPHYSWVYAAALMGDVDGLKHTAER